ncbi:putative bifunctional diguanylate cyclase/phosphodiesterase [Shewanella aestuarii]|uniref:EAL domain-containing protein n=1 Tax=Shewanella aestuarii TaxID=1028752 RepID=A0A6G9QIE6_9GAMM|nr:EAL domain-containing protein [Shewanella aestuarii]QIR13649.1 EAL domain-containing protein [Shewanella aestuarii]
MVNTTQQLLIQALTQDHIEGDAHTSNMVIDDVLALLCKQLGCDAAFVIKSCHNNQFAPDIDIVDISVKTVISHFCHHLSLQACFTQGIENNAELLDSLLSLEHSIHRHQAQVSPDEQAESIISELESLLGSNDPIEHIDINPVVIVGNVKVVIAAIQFRALNEQAAHRQEQGCRLFWQTVLADHAFQLATSYELLRLATLLTNKEKQYHELFSHLPMACALIDTNNCVVMQNQVSENMLRFQIGQSLFDSLRPDDYPLLQDTLHIVRQGVLRQAWCEIPLRSGIATHWYKMSFCDALNEQKQLLLMIEDITERYRLADELSFHSNHDALTGLPNRLQFEDMLDELLNSDEHIPACVAFLDLDQFQVVNDLSGHQAGDELLQQIAKRLKQLVRKGDVVARLGGDEFGILMYHSEEKSAQQVAKRICLQLSEHEFMWQKMKHNVSVSIGIATFEQDAKDIYEVMSQADAACRLAKEEGRNRWHYFNPDDPQIHTLYTQMVASVDIIGALALNQFELFYQLIEPLEHDETGLHMEILLRMVLEDGTYMSPAIFLPAAERYNLASRIDRWVIDNLLKWGADNLDIWQELAMVSVNLSAMSLADQKFMSWLEMRLMVEPELVSKLCFEITETAAVSQLNQATALIDLLKPMGCKLALDDFGSGFSSFAYLKTLDVDFVKIDGQFVVNLCDDKKDTAIVSAICQLGHDMAFDVIAEFVENVEIGHKLKRLGVDYAQGYAINKPSPLSALKSGIRTPWFDVR